ncbi:MAG: beta-lactamase family protein [Firmicutes bacterium]|nr:beta-lactamase family protein [Bacillota bacterium]
MLARTLALVKQFVDERNTPGAVMLVGYRGKMYGPYPVGSTSFFPEADPVAEDTLYDLASLTKVVATTTAALLLLEGGNLSLDNTVGSFLKQAPSDKREITLQQLMTHTAGIPQTEFYRELASPDDVIDHILHTELAFAPGTQVLYSCLNYILLGKILEKCASETLDVFVTRHVFEPLGMYDTCFNPPERLHGRIAYTEWCPIEKTFIRGRVHDENSRFLGGVSGNAGLFSTAGDLGIFATLLLQQGVYEKRHILHPRTVRLLNTNYTPELNESRSIGWMMKGTGFCSGGNLISNRAFGHTGFTGTSLWIDPELRAFFILLTNRVHPTRGNDAIIRFRPRFHNAAIAELTRV